jgi:Cupin superfamily protein
LKTYRAIATSPHRCCCIQRNSVQYISTSNQIMDEADLSSIQEESVALRSIIGGPTRPFFDEVWQQVCVLYSNEIEGGRSDTRKSFDLQRAQESPYQELLSNGWSSLVQLLEDSRHRYESPATEAPLLFQNRENVSPVLYDRSLFHAYLNGCSVVVNHADETCPYLATLCQDLQKSVPHAYANTYLTPPGSQAVPPHADDRDVLILQVYGKKHWKVYKNIPIPYPYPHEQVGKDGLEVPPQVLEGPCLIDCVLREGDVLYMPRGYVHEAQTLSDVPSYHVTIALATHDWTLAGLVTNATQHMLSRHIPYRQALPVHLGRGAANTNDNANVQALQEQLDTVFQELKTRITAETMIHNLAHRYELHNTRCLPARLGVMNKPRDPDAATNNGSVVGRDAAALVQLSSILRAATPDEKASIAVPDGPPKGLHVREATADTIMGILSRLKCVNGMTCRVGDMRGLVHPSKVSHLVCDLTLLSFAKSCVELGALAIVNID